MEPTPKLSESGGPFQAMGLSVSADDVLADAVEGIAWDHGGTVQAHLVLTVEPELRKLLRDRKLLQFLEERPERFEVMRIGTSKNAKGAIAGGLSEIKALRPAPTLPEGQERAPPGPRAIHAARLLADEVLFAAKRYAAKRATSAAGSATEATVEAGQATAGAADATATADARAEEAGGAASQSASVHENSADTSTDPNGLSWTPLPWLVRDKAVKQALQTHLLLRPRSRVRLHQDPFLLEALGQSGAWWAELAAHLAFFLREEWPEQLARGLFVEQPELRENFAIGCNLLEDGKESSKALLTSGYNCPCRLEVGCRLDDLEASMGYRGDNCEEELRKRVLQVVNGTKITATRVGADSCVQKLFRVVRQKQSNVQGGLLAWLKDQSVLELSQGKVSDEWWVRPAKARKEGRPEGRPEAKNGPANEDGDADEQDEAAAPEPKKNKKKKTGRANKISRQANSDSEDSNLPNDSEEEGEGLPTFVRPAAVRVERLGMAPGIVAASKPAGVSTEAFLLALAASLEEEGLGEEDRQLHWPLLSVSRLDLMTSGVLVVARGAAAEEVLKEQFKAKTVQKEYLCLCYGTNMGPPGFRGEVNCRLKMGKGQYRAFVSPNGKPSHTQFEVLARYQQTHPEWIGSNNQKDGDEKVFSLLKVKPLTGRTHQIRAHMASIGCPLVSDTKYSPRRTKFELPWCRRMFLHCRKMALLDTNNELFTAEAPLPAELASALKSLDCLDPEEGKTL